MRISTLLYIFVKYGGLEIDNHISIQFVSRHVLTTTKNFFGENVSGIRELEKDISMGFPNGNLLIYAPRPHSPTMMELHQLHLKSVEALPEDLQLILDEAKKGVIYFSLGSNIKSVQLQENLKRTIIEALAELPYKIIWKYESEHLPNKPLNVVIKKWLPQQDILAHPNVRAFVTQGGLQSVEESIFYGVPLIGLPFIGDQTMNIKKIVDLGVGIGLDPVTVTTEQLKNSIVEVSENEVYKKKIQQVSKRLFDKPMQSVEEAVWWSEYMIRHKSARHLRTPNADISWFHYLLFDVLTLFIITLIVVSAVAKRFYKMLKFTNKK